MACANDRPVLLDSSVCEGGGGCEGGVGCGGGNG